MPLRIGAVIAVLGVTVACGLALPGGGGDGGTGASPSLEAACGEFAHQWCLGTLRCAPYLASISLGEQAQCEASRRASCVTNQGLSGVTRTEAQLRACAAAWATQDCHTYAVGAVLPECAWTGSLQDGQGCSAALQCTSGTCRAGTPCGTCVPKLGTGTTCTSGSGCAAGSTCVMSGTQGSCQPRVGLDAGCGAGVADCSRDAYCVDGSCVATGSQVGAVCDPSRSASCSSLMGLHCLDGACAALPASGPGESCVSGPCRWGLYCGDGGVCTTRLEAGAGCDARRADQCGAGLSCRDGGCEAATPAQCP